MDQLSALHWTLIGGAIYLLAFSALGAHIAYRKRRSILEGFLFGFLLGPIGIVWEFFMRTVSSYERARKSEEEKEIFRHISEHYQSRSRKPLGDVDNRRPAGGV
jgi:hypothetical protein